MSLYIIQRFQNIADNMFIKILSTLKFIIKKVISVKGYTNIPYFIY